MDNHQMETFVDSMPLLTDAHALREQADRDGYLYFKGLLPAEPLLELRRQILLILQKYGWLSQDHPMMDAVADRQAVTRDDMLDESMRYIGVTRDAYLDIQRLQLFHTIPHHHRLMQLYENLLGGNILPHPRHIARVLLPAPSFAPTPPHQDYVHIQGTHGFWTCWFPLGDCPKELGGLAVLKGSHKEEVLGVSAASGAGGVEAILCDTDYRWVSGDYHCGDVITFPSHTVHRGTPCNMKDHLRISCDLRYQRADEEIESNSLQPHMNIASWEELYRGWANTAIQYYWTHKNLTTTTFDHSLVKSSEKIC